ncbi:MAG: hypothetical protein ABRQ39_19590 [Candidatus Eremiobacterota bacterium]
MLAIGGSFGFGAVGMQSYMQMGMGGGIFSAGFMSSMGMFGGMSSMCAGTGGMTPFMGMPGCGFGGGGVGMAGGGLASDADLASLNARIARRGALINQKCKTAKMGGFLGKLLGFAAGVGIAALVLGTGGAALPLAPLLMAGVMGSGVGSHLGFLLGGGGSLSKGMAL